MVFKHIQFTRKKLLLSAVVCVVAATSITAILFFTGSRQPLIPAEYSNSASFEIFAPQPLPDDYILDVESLKYESATLLFTIYDTSGNKINFSEQTIPAEFNFDSFYSAILKDSRKLDNTPFASTQGTDSNGDKTLSIEAGKTWVVANAKASTSDKTLQQIAERLVAQSK